MITSDTEKLFKILLKDIARNNPKDKAIIQRGKAIFARAKKDTAAFERARQKAQKSYDALSAFVDEIRTKV